MKGNSSLGRRADRAGIGPIAEAKLTMRDARAWISKMINLKDQSRIVDIRRNQSWGPAGKKARNFPIAVVPCRQVAHQYPTSMRLTLVDNQKIGRIQQEFRILDTKR